MEFTKTVVLLCAIAAILMAPQVGHAALVHHYKFDNANNLGEDSVGGRDMALVNIGPGAGVSQALNVGDVNGLVRASAVRFINELPKPGADSNTTQGSFFRNQLGASTTLNNFTAAMFIQTDVLNNDGFTSFFSNGPNTGNNNFQLDLGNNNVSPDDIRLEGRNGTNHTAGSVFALNDWIHVAVTWDGTTSTFYIDGAVVDTHLGNPGNEFQAIRVGVNRGETRTYEGLFDDLQIHNMALDAGQIAALAATDVVVIPEPTTATLGLIGLAGLVARRRRAA